MNAFVKVIFHQDPSRRFETRGYIRRQQRLKVCATVDSSLALSLRYCRIQENVGVLSSQFFMHASGGLQHLRLRWNIVSHPADAGIQDDVWVFQSIAHDLLPGGIWLRR